MKYSPLLAFLCATIALLTALPGAAGAETPAPEPAAVAPDTTADSAAVPIAPPDQVAAFNYRTLENRILEVHPILKEKRTNVDKTVQQLHELKMAAILPKFVVETAVGPAPGLKSILDTTSLTLPSGAGI